MVKYLRFSQTSVIKLVHQLVAVVRGSLWNLFRIVTLGHAAVVRLSVEHRLQSVDKLAVKLSPIVLLKVGLHHLLLGLRTHELLRLLGLRELLCAGLYAVINPLVSRLHHLEKLLPFVCLLYKQLLVLGSQNLVVFNFVVWQNSLCFTHILIDGYNKMINLRLR